MLDNGNHPRQVRLLSSALATAGAVALMMSAMTGTAAAVAERDRLTAPVPSTQSTYASAVALSGNTVVVGAPGLPDPSIVRPPGKAYVYTLDAQGRATLRATLTNGETNDRFGENVAIDGNTIVIGVGGQVVEKAFVFTKPANGWRTTAPTAVLTQSDPEPLDAFGTAVDVQGNTVAVGAGLHDVGAAQDSGAVYVYTKPASGWRSATETARLTARNAMPGMGLGQSVAVSGATVVSGASGMDRGAVPNTGGALVFQRSGNQWTNSTQKATLTAGDAWANSDNGHAVAFSADAIAVGAPSHEIELTRRPGLVRLYQRPAAGWSSTTRQTATLRTPQPTAGDSFGEALDAQGEALIVGATTQDAYVFRRPATGWTGSVAPSLLPNPGTEDDLFGYSGVAVSGSLAVIAAELAAAGGKAHAGAVYIFDTTPDPTAITVSARSAKKKMVVKKKALLTRTATTNGTVTAVTASCLVKGKAIKKKARKKVCAIRQVQTPTPAGVTSTRVQVTPKCNTKVSARVTITAQATNAAPATWTRTWKVKPRPRATCPRVK